MNTFRSLSHGYGRAIRPFEDINGDGVLRYFYTLHL
jgi:hypothetical protein